MANETLVTISQRTGFSISTISRVLSGQAERYRISPATVQLIEEEAKRCNYIPNLLAKGLTTRRTNIIGLLIPSVDNPYFANIASVVIRQAKTQGFTTMVVDTMENEKNEQQDVLSLISRKVDGIIIVPWNGSASTIFPSCSSTAISTPRRSLTSAPTTIRAAMRLQCTSSASGTSE